MLYNVRVDEKDYKLEIVEDQSNLKVRMNGQTFAIDNYIINGGQLNLMLKDNVPYEVLLSKDSDGYQCWLNSRLTNCQVIDEKAARFASLMGANAAQKKRARLRAPMPGLVVRIEVEAGQEVKRGDGLIVVEAMKMENELKAPYAGKIKSIKILQGQAVEKNQVLLEFE
jgi:biotin carboxyl carrier protein